MLIDNWEFNYFWSVSILKDCTLIIVTIQFVYFLCSQEKGLTQNFSKIFSYTVFSILFYKKKYFYKVRPYEDMFDT